MKVLAVILSEPSKVFAVILSGAKDPERLHLPPPPNPFSPQIIVAAANPKRTTLAPGWSKGVFTGVSLLPKENALPALTNRNSNPTLQPQMPRQRQLPQLPLQNIHPRHRNLPRPLTLSHLPGNNLALLQPEQQSPNRRHQTH